MTYSICPHASETTTRTIRRTASQKVRLCYGCLLLAARHGVELDERVFESEMWEVQPWE